MKNSVLNRTFQNKLWVAVLVSLIGLSACSNETEEKADTNNTETSEMTPVQTDSDTEASVNTSTDEAESADSTDDDAGGTAYYSGVDSVENEQKADDTATVNENNSNLDKTAAEGLQ
ncbi:MULTISPECIES: hypothetical protein [unclassified Psychrobacter]|uniref:hypothetical protein n=1 Tax=unclassified Psychrobacter TaxID=196806 RepID=UPI00071E6CBD|nr:MULTISPECIES: hypothetical protein [unclassified Psychrobacter]OLF36204.1 hypothetical protein BTV98_11745 [Psychrobacter sp. Cmf 22.2]